MKIKVNRNILWAEIFVRTLTSEGVRFACISPGSRSTPLTFALAADKNITSYIHIDERSGGFFATGLARKTGMPVIILCTSGTAVAEFYPAIIEAFQQRIPLIVCTADRPSGSFLKGLNQTINQENIYRNHIRWFSDAGIPDVRHLADIRKTASLAVAQSLLSRGPVHINFPFDKPFEPDSYTDEIESSEIDSSINLNIPKLFPDEIPEDVLEKISSKILNDEAGFITVGPSDFPRPFREALIKLSEITAYPILADGASGLRFGEINPNIISNYGAIFRSGFLKENGPSVIIHFGSTMTSKGYEDFTMNYGGSKFLVNKFGDVFDPAGRYTALIQFDEVKFAFALIKYLEAQRFGRKSSSWKSLILDAESTVCCLKKSLISSHPFPDECRLITELLGILPENCSVMLSNSLSVRDFDYFAESMNKNLNIFHNRGASGIDGIVSTALGIASQSRTTVLITGDLAFFYDMNGLLAGRNYNIPLIIILVNNNGGGIFRALPVSDYPDLFDRYFITPHNLPFEDFVRGFGAYYKKIEGWDDLKKTFTEAISSGKLSVLEIRTDSAESMQRRRKFWETAKASLNENSTF